MAFPFGWSFSTGSRLFHTGCIVLGGISLDINSVQAQINAGIRKVLALKVDVEITLGFLTYNRVSNAIIMRIIVTLC